MSSTVRGEHRSTIPDPRQNRSTIFGAHGVDGSWRATRLRRHRLAELRVAARAAGDGCASPAPPAADRWPAVAVYRDTQETAQRVIKKKRSLKYKGWLLCPSVLFKIICN